MRLFKRWLILPFIVMFAGVAQAGCAPDLAKPSAPTAAVTEQTLTAEYRLSKPMASGDATLLISPEPQFSAILDVSIPVIGHYYCKQSEALEGTLDIERVDGRFVVPVFDFLCQGGDLIVALGATASSGVQAFSIKVTVPRAVNGAVESDVVLTSENRVAPVNGCGNGVTDIGFIDGPELPDRLTFGQEFTVNLTPEQSALLQEGDEDLRLWVLDQSTWRRVSASAGLENQKLKLSIQDVSLAARDIAAFRISTQSARVADQSCNEMEGDQFRGLTLRANQDLGTVIIAPLERLHGPDRYATSAAVSARVIRPGANVFVASGVAFPDALAAGPAAASEKAALLLSQPDRLPATVASELRRINPPKVYVVGSAATINEVVVSEIQRIAPGAKVERIAGKDRYETAAKIADLFFPDAERYLVATGLNFPDALSATAVGSRGVPTPILLTLKDRVPDSVRVRLSRSGIKQVTIIGTQTAVNSNVESSIRTQSQAIVERIGGSNRYETNILAISSLAIDEPSEIIFATGEMFADALSASMLAASNNAAIILTTRTCHVRVASQYLRGVRPLKLYALGSSSAVPDNIVSKICA